MKARFLSFLLTTYRLAPQAFFTEHRRKTKRFPAPISTIHNLETAYYVKDHPIVEKEIPYKTRQAVLPAKRKESVFCGQSLTRTVG